MSRSAFRTVIIGVVLIAGSASAQTVGAPGTVTEVSLPGGLRGSLAVLDDRVAPDRSQFLLEFIRRSFHLPLGIKNIQRDVALQALLSHLDRSSGAIGTAPGPETLPLPLPAATWSSVVFGGREPPQKLVAAILRSRGAALLYYGLLSLDEDTRVWLAGERELLAELALVHAAAFAVAAPGLRVAGGAVRVPGGDAARPVWEALAGRRANEPAAFLRAVIAQDEGRLAYFYAAMAQLTPAQIRFVMNLDAPDAAARIAVARRLQDVFKRIATGWRIDERAFWRPQLDPALLAADLRTDENGRPLIPAGRRFWSAVFGGDQARDKPAVGDDPHAMTAGDDVDFAWLSEQVFQSEGGQARRRYQAVQFASRIAARITRESTADAIEAVRAADAYPALTAVLERAKLADVAAFANAARRATRLGAIEDDERAVRALAQFQGALFIVTRAAVRGGLTPGALAELVSSLSAVDVNERGEYEGRLVRWFDARLHAIARAPELPVAAAGPMEADALGMLAGPAGEPRFVDWEGTRYRVDFAAAEAGRIARLLGEQPRPFLSSARTLVALSETLTGGTVSRDRLRQASGVVKEVAEAVGWDGEESWADSEAPRRYREAAALLNRAADEGDVRGASRIAPAFRALADELFARGLMELAYAVALGHPERSPILADEAAVRHDFGLRSGFGRRSAPWRLPTAGIDPTRGWRVSGSLFGLDVRLADFLLVRLSSRPPPRRPTLADDNRRVLIEAVALMPVSLADADRDAIVAAMRKGRARLAAIRTAADADALADEIRLGAGRRTLLAWVAAHEPERLAVFLAPSELLWLGMEQKPLAATLDVWGAPGEPRLGCLCLQLIDRRPWETLAGRWHSGIFASGFAELNLRLAELLADLRMPAALLGPVLAAATLDFVDTAQTRDPDDRRALVEFVQALRPDRVEQYLALLTTDGPLVPVNISLPESSVSRVPR